MGEEEDQSGGCCSSEIFLRLTRNTVHQMRSFSSIFAKGEELVKQMADKATVLADKMKEEEWVQKVSQSVNEV